MKKFLLFTTGGGSTDPLNWDSSETALYNSGDLTGIKASGGSSIDLFFTTNKGQEIVTLGIKNGSHSRVSSAIVNAITTSQNSVISIADVDNNSFINPSVHSVTIKTSTPILYYQKIADATQVNVIPIDTKLEKLTSMTLCNIHSGDATVTVFLANSTDNWYIIKDVVIPVGSTLKLESDELDYDANIFNLYVKLGGSTPVDVIVR